jgi:hypothetical protein
MKHRTYGVDFAQSGSPLTLTTESGVYHVAPSTGNPDTEPVSFQMSGTWNSATVTLHQCVDHTTSPLVFVSTGTAYTADKSGTWTLPTDTLFKLVMTGHGSPVPSINVKFKGDIQTFTG